MHCHHDQILNTHVCNFTSSHSFNARIFNAAFGGACTRHILQHFEALLAAVPRAPPDVIVFFCGTNDINTRASSGDRADRVRAAILDLSPFGNEIALNFSSFLLRVRERHPGVRAVYLENTVTPFVVAQGEERVAAFDALNEAVRVRARVEHAERL